MDSYKKFDFIIVGAGSAGCLLANRLSSNPENTVLLIEAGRKDNNPWLHVPVGYFKTMNNPKFDWMYQLEKDKGLNLSLIHISSPRDLSTSRMPSSA